MFKLPKFYYSPVPTCSNSCEGDLPAVNFNDCQPVVNFSEIRRIFIGKKGTAAFSDWTQPAEWLNRISSTGTGNDAIRVLTVIADKPAAAGVVKDISNGRRLTIGKDHTINFEIDDVSDENYEAMRALECGGEYKIWYETEGEKMFGGNEGISARVDANNVLGRGREEIEKIVGSFVWRSKFSPERTASPIFGTGSEDAGVYDTVLTFAGSVSDAAAGVTGTVPAADPQLQFQFDEITPRVGTPASMTLLIAAVEVAAIDYLTDYNGKPFRFINAAGVPYVGVFAAGNVTPTAE